MKKVYGWLAGILLAAMVCGAVSAFAEESGAQAGFVNNVQVLQEIRNEAQWQALPESDVDIALVKIDGDGKLSVGNEKADFRLSSFGNAIPALYVSDEAAAAAAVTVLTESAPYAFVVSDRPALVKSVRASCTTANGIVDFRGRSATVAEIQAEVNGNAAKSALVSYAQLGAEEIQTVRKLFINVYTEAEGEEQCIAALSAGADGVLCAQTSAILQALAPEGEDPAIYAPRPFVVSHRGNSQAVRGLYGNYYENTVEAARAAYDQYRPDFVEIDLYLSSDGYVVISHDPSLDRMTNGTGNIESMTLDEIRRYKVDGGLGDSAQYLDEIPTLDDYFEEFKDDDLFFLLEIKSAKPECVDAAVYAIKKYGMEQRVNFISFDAAQLSYAAAAAPDLSVSFLTNGYEYNVTSETFEQDVMDIINPLNASLSPNWERMTDEGVKNLNRYGIKVNAWTLNMEAAFFREIKNIGYATYTTDFCNWMEKQPYTLRPNETEIAAAPDERFALTADLILWNGQEQADVEVTALYVSPNIQKDGDRYFITEGEGVIVLLYEGKWFSLLSEPIVVRAQENPAGCGSFLQGDALSVSILCFAVVCCFITKKK